MMIKNDPHRFCASNKVVLRLRWLLSLRQRRDYDFSQNDRYRLYKIVREAESEFMTRLQSSRVQCELQADDEIPANDTPITPAFFGWGASPQNSDAKFREEVLRRIQVGEKLDGLDWDAPGSLENHQQVLSDTFWLHVESAVTLYSQLKTATDWTSIYNAVAQYLRVVTGKPISSIMAKVYEHVADLVRGIMSQAGLQSEEDTENPFTRFRYWLGLCETVAKHPMVVKIKKIFYYLMSFSLLERFGISFDTMWYTKAEAELLKNQHSSKSSFFQDLIEGTSYILERLYDCYRTGSWNAIIHSGRTYGSWVDEVYALKEAAQMLHNPEANGISYHEFLGRVDSCVERGEAICRYAEGLESSEKVLIKRLLSDIRLIKAQECTKKAARQSRQTPFTILYYGGSGIGKSTLQTLTFQHFGKVHGLPCSTEYHYTRSFSDEYWSGFQTSMWSIVLDDIAARNPNANQGDPSMEEVLQIINQVPYTPPQADLADKGKTPLRPLLVQGTTNVKTLNASSYYCNQLAILRRFPMVVTPVVKEQYAKIVAGRVPDPADRMLDSSRVPPLLPGEYPDYWEFTVERVVAHTDTTTGQQYAVYEPYFKDVVKFTSIYEYLAAIGRESIAHKANQAIVAASEAAYRTVQVCSTCCMPQQMCRCVQEVQSGEMILIGSGFGLLMLGLMYLMMLKAQRHAQVVLNSSVDRLIVKADTLLESHKERIVAQVEAQKEQLDSFVAERMQQCVSQTAARVVQDTSERIAGAVGGATNVARKIVRSLDEIRAQVAASAISAKEKLQCECAIVRGILVVAGDRVRKHVVRHKVLYAFICFVPTAVAMLAAWRMWNTPIPQTSAEEGSRPTARDEKPNPWYRDDYEPSTFDVGALSSSWKALSMEQVGQKIYRNCLFARVHYERDGPKARSIRVFGLGGNLYVTNNHNIPEKDVELEIVMQKRVAGISSNFTFFLGEKDTYRIPDRDLVFFRINCCPPLPSLLDLLPGETFRTVCNGVLCGRGSEGEDEVRALRGIRFNPEHYVAALKTSFPSWCSTTDIDTIKGMCGSAVLGFTPSGPMVLGLHQTGGVAKIATAVSLTRELADQAIAHFRAPMVQAGRPDLTDKFGVEMELQPLHYKSVFRFLDKGTAHVYGSLPGFRATHRSKVKKTFIAEACEERGYEIKTGAPEMRGWQPWRHAAQDVVEQQFTVRQSLLDECVQSFAQDILSRLGKDQLDEMIVLDNATTLNGYPGTKFIDKMNRRTSMGFPYREKKLHYLVYKGNVDVWDDYVEFHDRFYERVDGITELYERGIRYMPVFTGHLKDEALKLTKVHDKKTRVFSGGPAEWCFVVRKHLLSFVRVVQNNKYIFESAPGTNATSVEWDQIYHYLTEYGEDRIIAGDYSKFDKRMSAQWILAAFQVIDLILNAAGRSERDRMIVQGIAYDTAFPLTDFNGDLVEFWGSNPSGHPLTVIVNGLVNALYVRYAWAMQGNRLDAFKENVNLMTYGDDNIMGVSRTIDNFDHTIIAKNLATLGVVYTMADKETESVPFVNIDEVSFLKRGWRYEPEVGHHVAQLEHDSIAKMLTMHIPSKVVCQEQHSVDIMFTALAEYFFYGREEFDKRREMFLDIIEQEDLAPYYLRPFPTFDEILHVYKENSKDVYEDGRCPLCQ